MNRLGSTAARLKLKGIDGDLHKRWIMWFNSTINEEPHQGLKPNGKSRESESLLTRDRWAGDAWLSSVRGLNCSLKWGNERNPCCLLQVSGKTVPFFGKEAGMTPSQHVPLMPWATHMIQWLLQKVATGRP